MGIGITVTKDHVNTVVGQLALDIADVSARVVAMKAWLDQTPDADLVALGFEEGEVAVIKSAIGDAAHLMGVARGEEPLAAEKDFFVFLRRLWGFGRK